MKTKRKGILRTLLCGVFALCMAAGLSSLFASGTTAYAATTPKYTVKFNWSVTTTTGTDGGTGNTTSSGTATSYSMQTGQYSNVDYSITLYGSSSTGTGTFESGSYIGSNAVNIVINSKVKIQTSISGNGKTVASGNNNSFSLTNLADGTYTVTSTFAAAWATSSRSGISKSYMFSFEFKIDMNAPTMNNVSASSFVASTVSSVVFSKTAVNGTYALYAVDGFGNKSDTYYMYMSIDAPEATIIKSDNSHKVCVIWTATGCSATLNGKSYASGTWIE